MALSIQHRRLAIAAGMGAAGLCLVAAVAVVGPRDGSDVRGPGVRIAHFVAAPAEIEPGTTMEVGELTDGYVHQPAPAVEEAAWIETDDGWWEDEQQAPPPGFIIVEPPRPEPQRVAEDRRIDSMGLGFESRADVERDMIRPAPPERRPDRQGDGVLPPPSAISGERQAVFY